jgi:hypothetical protein
VFGSRWVFFFGIPNPFSRTVAPGFCRPVAGVSYGSLVGVECCRSVRLRTWSPYVRRCLGNV